MGQYVPGGGLGMFLAKLGQNIPTTSETERQRAELDILRQRAEAGREQMERERQAEEQRRFEEEQLANAFDPDTGTVNMERLGMGLQASQQPGMMPRKISMGTLKGLVDSNRQNAYLASRQKQEALAERRAREAERRALATEMSSAMYGLTELPPDVAAKEYAERVRPYYMAQDSEVASVLPEKYDPNYAKVVGTRYMSPKAMIDAKLASSKAQEDARFRSAQIANMQEDNKIKWAQLAEQRASRKEKLSFGTPDNDPLVAQAARGLLPIGRGAGFSLNNPENKELIRAAMRANPKMTVAKAMGITKTYNDFMDSNSPSAKTLTSHDTVYGHALELKDAIRSMGNDRARVSNAIKQWLLRQSGGNEKVKDFDVGQQVFTEELAKALGMGTGAERLTLQEIFSKLDSSPSAITAVDSAASKVATRSGAMADSFYRLTDDGVHGGINPIEAGVLPRRVAEGILKSPSAKNWAWARPYLKDGIGGNVGNVGSPAPPPATPPTAAQPVVKPVAPEGTISRDRRFIKRNGKWEPYNGQ